MSALLKNLTIALIITLVLGAVYYMTKGSDDDTLLDSGSDVDPNSDVSLRTEKILADTQKINRYMLDDSIYSDVRFRSLKDFRVEIIDVGTGRVNPFEEVQ